MSNATPLFLITDAGLAAASVATPTGPYIHITSFQIGSAYGYTPTVDDTGINGTLLFTGVPTSYEYIGNNTLNIICEIPPDAGPWQFGEVALFLPGGVMFAKAVFDTPQTKFSSLGTNVVSSYTFNCLLKLQQSTAVFQIDTINAPPACVDIFQWSDVFPPGVSANPDVPLYLVRELAIFGDSSLLQNTSDAEWSVGTTYAPYMRKGLLTPNFTVQNSSTTWVEVPAAQCHPLDLAAANRVFLLETPDGFFRSVSSVVTSGSNYRFNLNCTNDGTYNNTPLINAPSVGTNVRIYRGDGARFYSELQDSPPPPANATVGTPGLAYGGSGLYMPSPGVIEAHGLLHLPDTNVGRTLTGGDNLNNSGLPSGVYNTNAGAFGLPANMPVSWDGSFIIQNTGNFSGLINQTYYPFGTGGGDGAGNNGYPIYFRSYTGSSWTNWFPLYMLNKQGSNAGGGAVTVSGIGTSFSTTVTQRSHYHIFSSDGGAGSTSQMTRNGVVVSRNTKGGGAGYGRVNHDMCFFLNGDTLAWNGAGAGTMVVFTF